MFDLVLFSILPLAVFGRLGAIFRVGLVNVSVIVADFCKGALRLYDLADIGLFLLSLFVTTNGL